jgi:gldM family protein
VLSFETTFFDNMGNARPETVSGSSFSENQRNLMRSLRRGQRFYISNVKAVGPDGITRTLPQALPVIVN